jgi:ribosomal protein L11 methyltransferase
MHFQVTIQTVDWQDLLIALMSERGYEGFEQEDALLKAFIPEADFDQGVLEELLTAHGLTYTLERIEERNWNEEWEKHFQPVVVETFCAIRAHFHAPISGVEHELVITPKMSFGTGHHATTYMMLQSMQGMDLRGKRVLDFGTGTGVLAILAEKLGAEEVVAIDVDDWSINNAQENTLANECFGIVILKEDRVANVEGVFDLILANINKHVIVDQLGDLGQHLAPEGVILLSGLLQNDSEDIENEAIKNNLSVSNWMTRGSWICLTTEKKPPANKAGG